MANKLKQMIMIKLQGHKTCDSPYDNDRVEQQAIKKAKGIFDYIEKNTGIRVKGNPRFYQQVSDWLDEHYLEPKYKQIAEKIDKQLDILKDLLSDDKSGMLRGLNPGKFFKRYVKRYTYTVNPKHELNRHGNKRKSVSRLWKNYEDL